MRYLIFTIALSLLFLFSNAQYVSREDALKTGTNFFNSHAAAFNVIKSTELIEEESLIKSPSGKDCIYAFEFKDGGFILVSADKRAYPVLAYSFDDEFDINNMAPGNRLWLDKYLEQFDIIEASSIEVTPELKAAWESYSNNDITSLGQIKGVSPLLTTKWNQDYPYNYYCPEHVAGPGGRVYAGCVATAMAQVMKFWNYPETGRGTGEYFWGDYFTIDFGETTYDWDSMSNSINSTSRNAIAELIFHCAVSVNMTFSHTGSGSSITNSFFALKQNFRYRAGVKEIDKGDVEDFEWKLLLKEDLDKGHPILYRGTDDGGNGHAFVCDGYTDTTYFHFNWGWGGYGNGNYYLDNINPQMDFHWGQGALFNLTPNYAEYCSSMVYDQPTWTFDDGSGPNYYFNDTECEWLISLTEHDYDFLKIYFNKYDLLEGDVLTFYDGNTTDSPVIGTYTSATAPSEIISYSNEILVKFVSNSDGQADGWELTYETITLGVNDQNKESKISVFPNPTENMVSIIGMNAPATVSIVDMSGRIVICQNDFENSSIDLSYLESGLYFIQIAGHENYSYKIIKE
jgi:hypothetical protein